MSTTVYSQVLIHTAESTGALMERTKMPNLRNGTKGGFEPGLTWLRVRHSTAELPRSRALGPCTGLKSRPRPGPEIWFEAQARKLNYETQARPGRNNFDQARPGPQNDFIFEAQARPEPADPQHAKRYTARLVIRTNYACPSIDKQPNNRWCASNKMLTHDPNYRPTQCTHE